MANNSDELKVAAEEKEPIELGANEMYTGEKGRYDHKKSGNNIGSYKVESGEEYLEISTINVIGQRDDNGKVSYKIAEEPEKQIEEHEK